LSNLNLKNITEELLEAFIRAGAKAKEINQRGLKIKIKTDKSPVTDGDIAVDKILKSKIISLTPNIPIISEETVNLTEKNTSKTFWLIDPIDGTKDYIRKKDEYTINASLIIDLQPAIGIVYAPSKDRLFFSYGKGNAYEICKGNKKNLNCKKIYTNEIIALVNSDKTPKEILDIHEKHKVSKTIMMSSSLKFCVLAAGEADLYAAKARAFEWDIAAGHAVFEHAGGIMTTDKGKQIFYGKEGFRNLPIIAKRALNLEK